MAKRLVSIIALLLLPLAWTSAQDMPDFRVLEKQFREMPMEARRFTQPLFWLHGDESRERLQLYLEKTAEGHNGGFCAESRPHNDWLGPKWYEDLDTCLQAARKLGMKMWIFDEKWWPSQTVAGKVPPEYAAKRLAAETFPVDGPAHFRKDGFGSSNFISVIAGRVVEGGIDGSSLTDLTSRLHEGVLDWDAPEGTWQVMKFSWTLAPPAVQGGKTIVDGASQDCVDWFLKTVYQPHYDRFKDDFGKTIVGYFYDEPETQGDWGTELSKVFAERGLDEKKMLVAWKFGLAGGEQAAARYAYIDALGETWGRTMYGSTQKWCNDRGVALIGHFMEHGGLYLNHGLGAINLFQMQKYNDMGGMDLVCQQLWPGERKHGIYQLPKLTSSISHAYHKADDLAMCEIYGAYGQGITYPQMKWLLDWHQVRGVNMLVPHSFNPRAPNDTDCPPYFYSDDAEPRWPLYRIWADYNNRLSLLLTGGRHVCPIALLFCGNSIHAGKAVTPEDMTTTLQDALYDCDWLPYDVFEKDASIDRKEVRLHDERYRVLIVPPVETIPYETLEKVRQFFYSGGVVIAYGFVPSKSATMGHPSKEIQQICKELWGDGKPSVFPRKTSETGGWSFCLPQDVTPEQIRQVLADNAGVYPVLQVLGGDTNHWLHALHRAKAGRDIFLICNQDHDGPARRFRLLAETSGTPECWDALRNEITALPCKRQGPKKVEFEITLEPSESALVICQPGRAVRPMRLADGAKPVRTITVSRIGGRPKAPTAQTLNLAGCPWVWYPEGDPRTEAPVGTRWFRQEVVIPTGRKVSDAHFLVTADNDFTLFVNGRRAGASTGKTNSWKQPRTIDIAGLLKEGNNVLAVAAVNTAGNVNPAGLIGRYLISFKQGAPLRGAIDKGWKTSDKETAGWNAEGFDAGGWQPAKEIAIIGDAPWGSLNDRAPEADPFSGKCTIPSGVDLKVHRVYVEMEDLREGASIEINGQFAGGVIGKPYRLDVTRYVKPGANTVEIQPYAPETVHLAVYK